jgi:hypothetical protein
MTAPTPGLSRRALFGIGASTLLAAAAVTGWRWRSAGAEAAPQAGADGQLRYADHDGWMVTPAEKQALRTQPPPGEAR